MFCSSNKCFCGCQQKCCKPDCCKSDCCKPNCCCKPRPCCPPRTVFGSGMFFNEDQQYLTDFVTPGNLAATGYKDVQVPLNVFNPLLCFRGGSASLVAQCGGLYELRYSLVAQFLPTVPFEVFVGKIVGDAVTPIEETLETVGNSLFGLAAEEEYALEEIAPEEAVLAGPAQARVPFPPILLPRFISKTAQVCLAAGAQIGLFVRLQNIGVLNVLPGAMLSAQRVGA